MNLQNIETVLNQLFPSNRIILEKVTYGGIISVFIVDILNEDELIQIWSKLSSSIAAYYQAYLDNDFEKWNIYIIYKCKQDISLNLMYKIENDKFSSRKIVHIAEKENDNLNNIMVANYITNKDLKFKEDKLIEINDYTSDSKIWPFISRGKIKPNRKSNKEVEIILEQIEKELQDEN